MCKQAEKKKQHHQMYLKLNNAENWNNLGQAT